MSRERLIEQFMDSLRHDPQASAPPELDPATADFVRQLVAAESMPPAADTVKARVWRQALAMTEDNRAAAREDAPWPGAWYIHPNGRDKPKKKENNPMQTAITQPKTIPRATAQMRPIRLARLAAAILTIALFTALLLPNLVQDNSPSGPAAVYLSPEAANQAIFERYINEVWNAGNTAVLNDILTADHVCHEPGMPEMVGIDGMVAMITNYRTAFPDWTFTIESLTITDDEVWARLTGTGTHTGPFTTSDGAVVAATGGAVTVEVMLNARFTDGQIAAQWIQSDDLGLLLQTGALPTPQQAITEAHNLATARLALEGYHFGKDRDVLQQVYPRIFVWQYGNRPDAHMEVVRDSNGGHYPEQIYDAFEDLEMTIDSMTATGDMVMAKLTVTGRFVKSFTVSWASIALTPTNELETWTWILIWRFEDGQVVEEYWVWDWPLMHGE